jgi:hypothetical protein
VLAVHDRGPPGRSTHFLLHENRQVKCSMSPCEPNRTASPAKDPESRSIPRPHLAQGTQCRKVMQNVPGILSLPHHRCKPSSRKIGCCSSICWSNASGGGNDERPSDGNSSTTTGLRPDSAKEVSAFARDPKAKQATGKKRGGKAAAGKVSSLYPPKCSSWTRFSRPCSGGNSAAKMSIRARTQRKVLDFACTCD